MTENASTAQRYEQPLQQAREQLHSPSEKGLNQALLWLDEAAQFAGDNTGEVQNLRAKIEKELSRLRAKHEYEQALAECRALWAQEQELLKAKTSPDIILEKIYGEARKRAETAYNRYHFPLLEGLKNDAQIQYERARQRYQIKTTADRVHNYREALAKLEAESDNEREIAWFDENGQFIGHIKVREAIASLTTDAKIYASNKAGEYLSAAKTYLEQFQPRLAREILEKRKELYLLPGEDETSLLEFDREKVQPALENLELAESLSAQAAASQDLTEGWEILRQAISAYPKTPAVEDSRKTLLNRTLYAARSYLEVAQTQYNDFCQSSRVKKVLQESETALKKAQNLRQQAETAQKALQESLENLRTVTQNLKQQKDDLSQKNKSNPLVPLLESQIHAQEKRIDEFSTHLKTNETMLQALQTQEETLSRRVQAALSYQEQIEAQFANLEKKIDTQPEKARNVLLSFLETYDNESQRALYGELTPRLPALKTLQTQVLAFENFAQALQTLEDAFLSNTSEQIAQAAREAEALAKTEADSARRRQIDNMLKRLRGRLDFLQGQNSWQEGDLAVAQPLLERVKALSEHPDKAEAQAILAKIKNQREQEQEFQTRLSEARALLEKQPKRAYELLAKLFENPSRFKGEIGTAMERARQKWEEDLLTRLDETMKSPSAMAEELIRIAEELLGLPEPRSLHTTQKARQARALAFASDARIHEKANRPKQALTAWNQARQLDPTRPEYEENWRRFRLESARRDLSDLSNNPGESETLGILSDLQNELMDDPQVLSLTAEQYHRLSRLETLNAEQQFEYLERAWREIKSALARPEFSSAERGRLNDLLKKIERDHDTLRQQADLEHEIKSEISLSKLTEALKTLDDLRKSLAADRLMLKRLDAWWERLRDEVVKQLETADEALAQDVEQCFEVRSKIALLSPEHRLAREVGPTIVRQSEKILREIETVVDDYKGIQIEMSKSERREFSPPEMVNSQQARLEELRKQADMLYGLLERFGTQAGGDTTRLKADFIDKRNKLTTWLDKVSAFYRALSQLFYELTIAKQDSSWIRFDDILKEITNTGFGDHRATRQVLQMKDDTQTKRKRLEQLCQEVLEALKNPRGEKVFEAQEALERLISEDPEDEFGLQESLVVEIPFRKGLILRGSNEVKKWLDKSIAQVRAFGNWLYQSGVQRVWPRHLSKHISESIKECANWEDARAKVQELQEKGQFKEALLLLDATTSDGQAPITSRQHLDSNFEKLIKNYGRFLPLETALQQLSHLPFDVEALLPFLQDLLPPLDEIKKKFQQQLDSMNEMRRQTQRKKNDWSEAQIELEQSLENLRTIEQSPLRYVPLSGYDAQLSRTRKRYQEARLKCQEIAPNHPLLKTLD